MRFLALTAALAVGCSDPPVPADDAADSDVGEAPNPCLETNSCTIFGKCTPMLGVCMAGSDADCAQSDGCRDDEECVSAPPSWDDGGADRTAHLACWARGPDGIDFDESDDDCIDYEGCVGWGACKYADGECWAPGETRDECEDPKKPDGTPYLESGCANFGFCTPKDGVCQAWTPGDCDGTYVCTNWQECTVLDGECWQSAE